MVCNPCKCDLPENKRRRNYITAEDMFQKAQQHFEAKDISLTTRWRKRNLVEARQMAMTIIAEHSRATLKNIGLMFGGRDHTTVIHARQSVRNLCYSDKNFKQQYELLRFIMIS